MSVRNVWMLEYNCCGMTVLSAGDILDTAGNVVDQSPIGRCLGKMMKDSEEHLQQMFQLYISDLLCFTFPMSDQQHQVRMTLFSCDHFQLHVTTNNGKKNSLLLLFDPHE